MSRGITFSYIPIGTIDLSDPFVVVVKLNFKPGISRPKYVFVKEYFVRPGECHPFVKKNSLSLPSFKAETWLDHLLMYPCIPDAVVPSRTEPEIPRDIESTKESRMIDGIERS